MNKHQLTKNMRANDDTNFATWLLQLGNGQLPVIPGTVNMIQIPDKYLTNMPIEDYVFPKEMTVKNLSEYSNRVILCPKNEDCLKLNDNILNSRFIDESIQYISIDSIAIHNNRLYWCYLNCYCYTQ